MIDDDNDFDDKLLEFDEILTMAHNRPIPTLESDKAYFEINFYFQIRQKHILK